MKISETGNRAEYRLLDKDLIKDLKVIKERRAELLVELFFEDLNPIYLAKVNSDKNRELPFDYLIFLQVGGALIAFGVLVKAYGEKSESLQSVQVSADEYAQLTGSTLPILIAAVDVKEKRIYSDWARKLNRVARSSKDALNLREGRKHILAFFEQSGGKDTPSRNLQHLIS